MPSGKQSTERISLALVSTYRHGTGVISWPMLPFSADLAVPIIRIARIDHAPESHNAHVLPVASPTENTESPSEGLGEGTVRGVIQACTSRWQR